MKQQRSNKTWLAGGFILLASLSLWRPGVCYADTVAEQPPAIVTGTGTVTGTLTAGVTGWCQMDSDHLLSGGVRLHDGAAVYMVGKGILARPVAVPDAVLVRPGLAADLDY